MLTNQVGQLGDDIKDDETDELMLSNPHFLQIPGKAIC